MSSCGVPSTSVDVDYRGIRTLSEIIEDFDEDVGVPGTACADADLKLRRAVVLRDDTGDANDIPGINGSDKDRIRGEGIGCSNVQSAPCAAVLIHDIHCKCIAEGKQGGTARADTRGSVHDAFNGDGVAYSRGIEVACRERVGMHLLDFLNRQGVGHDLCLRGERGETESDKEGEKRYETSHATFSCAGYLMITNFPRLIVPVSRSSTVKRYRPVAVA